MINPAVEDFVEGMVPIAAELGVEVARELVRQFGGTRLYVPRAWREQLPLNVVGEEIARQLCERFGPERIDFPLVPWTPDAIVRFVGEMQRTGSTNSDMARELGVSYKRIQRARSGQHLPASSRRLRIADQRQIDLVDWLNGAVVPSDKELLPR